MSPVIINDEKDYEEMEKALEIYYNILSLKELVEDGDLTHKDFYEDVVRVIEEE